MSRRSSWSRLVAEEAVTLIPLMVEDPVSGEAKVPMGDAILSLPIALEGGFRLLIPNAFVADLLAPLTEVRIVREAGPEDLMISPFRLTLDPSSPFALEKWGSKELLARHPGANATLCWAMAIEMKLACPAPRLRRPCKAAPGRVGLFPRGSVVKRSMPASLVDSLLTALSGAGFDPVVCPDFSKPADLAAFAASCEGVVGVYTGPLHLAAAMGVPSVAVPLGDSVWAYRPLQENVCVLGPPCERCWIENSAGGERVCGSGLPLCASSVRPEDVLEALRGLWAGRPGGLRWLAPG